ncbi:MAG TPA: UbiA family prenyltransferase [Marmoricola sp.]|jgi:4-hydroxybenzoate polyprenyltransferase|nr:UbiA family prenyltransferase [Marmoricola sp.]
MSEAVSTKRGKARVRDLVRCAHPKQAVLLAVAVAVAADLAGRPTREFLLAGAAVLSVQLSLGMSNDLCDLKHDYRAQTPGKPLAEATIAPSTVSYWMLVLVLVSVPLAFYSGSVAAISLLITIPVGWIHNRWLHRTWLSFLGWVVSGALYPAFLAYGGWGGGKHGSAPTIAVTGAAAAIGLCLHLVTSLGDLVADNKAGTRDLPLRIALRIGAPRLLYVTVVVSVISAACLVVAGLTVGLRQ